MSRRVSVIRSFVALGLAVSGLVAGGVADGAAASGTRADPVPDCTLFDLGTHKGRLEGAAGSRFLTVRVTNLSDHACATPGWTRYRFHNRDGAVGFWSKRNPGYDPGAAPVVIESGGVVKSVLSWTSPEVVSRHACHPRRAVTVRMRLAGLDRPFTFHHLDTRVCTTKKYRPEGTRLAS